MSCPWQNLIWCLGLHSLWSDQICGWFCIYGAYMVIFIRIRRSSKLEFTSSLLDDESLICCCCHMHKDHILQLWCKIPIVLGAHMNDDCCCWWYQEVLTMILSSWYILLDTWMIIQSCIVGDMMMMVSYLCDDRLLLTYVDWCRCSQLMILGSCRSWWLYDIMWMFLCRSLLLNLSYFREMWLYAILMKGICVHTLVYKDTGVYIFDLKTFCGPSSEWKESDMGLTETIWYRCRGSIYSWHYLRRSQFFFGFRWNKCRGRTKGNQGCWFEWWLSDVAAISYW